MHITKYGDIQQSSRYWCMHIRCMHITKYGDIQPVALSSLALAGVCTSQNMATYS